MWEDPVDHCLHRCPSLRFCLSLAACCSILRTPEWRLTGFASPGCLVPGTGRWVVNGKPLEVYFPNKVHQQSVSEPFRTVGAEGTYDVFARINGGGTSGQAGALRLGVARALNEIDIDANRPTLKKAGFLTRDARVIERKKYGLKKARKRSQYSKR